MKHLALLFLFALSGCIDNSSDSSTSNKNQTELMPAYKATGYQSMRISQMETQFTILMNLMAITSNKHY